MTKAEIASELAKGGYSPFLQTVVGSIVNAQAWVCKTDRRPLVFVLYRRDTGEVVHLNSLPQEEEKACEILAFVADFQGSLFLPEETP